MTDAPLPPDAADELASAHLDGAVTDAERAQVEADGSLLARVQALAAVRAAVRTPVPVDPARREAALAAALAAAEEPGGVLAHDGSSTVVPLAARWRSAGRDRRVRYLAVAAAVAVVALAVPLLGRLGTEDDEADTASVALDAEASTPAGRDGAEESGAAADDAAGSAGGAAPEALMADDLGPFADLDALTAALREQPELGDDAYATPTTTGGAEAMTSTTLAACDGQLTLPADTEVLFDATATLGGTPVVVVVHRVPGGEPQLLVAAVDGCGTVVDQPL